MSDIVIGIIAGSIVALMSFILGLFGNIWYARYQENRQRQNEALKKHFTDLEEQYIKPTSEFLSNFSNREGIITYTNAEAQYSTDASHTSWPMNNLNQGFICFKEHFSTEASEISGLREQIVINNTNNKSFNKKLENLLEKRSHIPMKDYFKKANLNVPFFSSSIITFIRLSYMEHMQMQSGDKEVDDLNFNFHEAVYEPSQVYKNIIRVNLKDGRDLAEVSNTNEAEACKKALIEIAEDIDLMKKGQVLYTKAEELKNSSINLSRSFDIICEIHGKFGTALKKKGGCPICKLIFEE